MVDLAKQLAAEELEANPEDMRLDISDGGQLPRRRRAGAVARAGRSWPAASTPAGGSTSCRPRSTSSRTQPTFPFGAHVAVVEVDTETGAVHLRRMVAVDDAGHIINPLVAEGQVHGGLAAGIAQALHEELTYDEDGNPQNANLVSYGIPGPTELPSFELAEMETPTPVNPLGAKGIGESGTIGATPAVHSAVMDALRPYGVGYVEMPLTSERVWRAIQAGGGGS